MTASQGTAAGWRGGPHDAVVRAESVTRTFGHGPAARQALRGATLRVMRGELVALCGRSGSGKTTLLNVIAGLDTPTSGRVWVDGAEVTAMGRDQRLRLRREAIAMVFQSFALLPVLSAAENVGIPMRVARMPSAAREQRARDLLQLVGLAGKEHQRPYELSGGEQQRVAVARALANNPRLLLADEPTGQLDSATAAQIMGLLRTIVHAEGLTGIVATHDKGLMEIADRVVELRNGQLAAKPARRPGRHTGLSGLRARSTPRAVPRDQRGVHVLKHDGASDDHPLDVLAARHLVHDRQQDLFQDGAQPAGARAAQDRLVGHGLQRVLGELQVHPVQLEQPPVLLDQGVARLGEDQDESLAVQVVHAGDHRQAAHELRDHAELEQILGHYLFERVRGEMVVLHPQDRAEAHPILADPLLDDLLQTGERPAADKQHVGGVDLDELLVRVLAAALRRDRGGGPFQDLQQGLLHALAGHVTGDRRVLALPGDLVDLIDVDDARLGLLDVVLGRLDQLEQDVLDILPDVARLGQRGGVSDRERDVEQPGEGLGEQRLAGARGAEQQDVGLGEFDAVFTGPALAARLDPLVVVVHRDRQGLLGLFLADHIRVEELVDLAGLGQAVPFEFGRLGQFLLDDLVAQIDALVADVHTWAGNEFLDLLLTLATERALQQVTTIAYACHPATPLPVPVFAYARLLPVPVYCLRHLPEPPSRGLQATADQQRRHVLNLTVPPPPPLPRGLATLPACQDQRILLATTTLPRRGASGSTEPHR